MSQTTAKTSILLVDDEPYLTPELVPSLQHNGINVITATNPRDALDKLRTHARELRAVILDVAMLRRATHDPMFNEVDTQGGWRTGIVIGRHILEHYPDIPIIGYSMHDENRNWFEKHGEAFISKSGRRDDLDQAVSIISDIAFRRRTKPRCFIVHGHDGDLLYELKDYISSALRFGEPIVLRDEPGGVLTLIEKFESNSKRADVVFVLLTPDEVAYLADDRHRERPSSRARPNVILELGYFLAKLQRTDGKIILLRKGAVELPSDIHGMLPIDVTRGIRSQDRAIRRELSRWLRPSRAGRSKRS